jgi:LytR cell envelope-related transcriptional attenuator
VEYLKESEASIHHRRRQRRTALTLTAVALMMFGTFALAVAYYQGWVGNRSGPGSGQPLASPSCQRGTPAQALTAKGVTINVYNATDRKGLAASVAKSLRTQGFKVAKVANDPLSKSISDVGEVRHGPTGAAGATLAAARLSGAKVVRDERTDETVDFVLGNKFTALSAPPKVAPAKGSTPTPSC